MTIALFSDIHGNIHSLEKALKLIEKYKVDKYLFLGDMAGYYYYQNECIQLLNTLPNLVSLKGNHDEFFLKAINNKDYLAVLDDKYGKSYSLLANNITEESLTFFGQLKDYEKTKEYEAYHGSPNNYTSEYIYPDSKIKLTSNRSFIFLGHTHYEMDIKSNNTRIVNPGSIGQARDNNKASKRHSC